jgi:hypothetical protein
MGDGSYYLRKNMVSIGKTIIYCEENKSLYLMFPNNIFENMRQCLGSISSRFIDFFNFCKATNYLFTHINRLELVKNIKGFDDILEHEK